MQNIQHSMQSKSKYLAAQYAKQHELKNKQNNMGISIFKIMCRIRKKICKMCSQGAWRGRRLPGAVCSNNQPATSKGQRRYPATLRLGRRLPGRSPLQPGPGARRRGPGFVRAVTRSQSDSQRTAAGRLGRNNRARKSPVPGEAGRQLSNCRFPSQARNSVMARAAGRPPRCRSIALAPSP
jgi:hypothetical protein